jgi:hypothetical protein
VRAAIVHLDACAVLELARQTANSRAPETSTPATEGITRMTLITDRTAPAGTPTTNELDKIESDILSIPPAYYSFGSTPAPMENPVSLGDVETFMVRARCKGEKRSERSDGEMRHVREFEIQACWKPGERPPTAEDDDQPPLFGTDGEPTVSVTSPDGVTRIHAGKWQSGESAGEPEAVGDILNTVERPQFSNLTGDRDD